MTRRWVKEELRKNRLEAVVKKTVDYTLENRSTILTVLGIAAVAALFAGVIIKNRIEENRQAEKIYTIAQHDFYRFNYKETLKKLSTIKSKFPHVSIKNQVSYLQGLSYFKLGQMEDAAEVLKKASSENRSSPIRDEMLITLGASYEKTGRIEDAISAYSKIGDGSYLFPEALAATGRLYEEKGLRDKAIDAYTRVQSHYSNSYWAEFSSGRLQILGVQPKGDTAPGSFQVPPQE